MSLSRLFVFVTCIVALIVGASSELVRMPIHKTKHAPVHENIELEIRNGPLSIQNSLNSQYLATLNIQNYLNSEYFATIQLGSNGDYFNVRLDTGSSVMWVPDSSLYRLSWWTFSCDDSTTCVSNRSDYQDLYYGKGEAHGYSAIDTLILGNLTIPNFKFLIADKIKNLLPIEYDGIIGLSLGKHLPGFPRVLDYLKDMNLITPQRLFYVPRT